MFNHRGHNSIEFLFESCPQYLPKLMLIIFVSIRPVLVDVLLIESINFKLKTTTDWPGSSLVALNLFLFRISKIGHVQKILILLKLLRRIVWEIFSQYNEILSSKSNQIWHISSLKTWNCCTRACLYSQIVIVAHLRFLKMKILSQALKKYK